MKLSRNLNLYLLIAILVFTALSRLIHLDYPSGYVFDEVYHAFTAKEYLKGDLKAWEWWNTPPPGVAYEWTHPPVAKEIMALSMRILHSTSSFAYRLPGVLLGILSVFLVYKLGIAIFKKKSIALTSAFIFSLDGLNFVQSRTGMNDIYIVTFALASLLLFLNKRFFFSSILLGLAIASKWSGVYLLGMYMLIFMLISKQYLKFLYFIIIPILIYLLSYAPFFGIGTPFVQASNLNKPFFAGGLAWSQFVNIKALIDQLSPFVKHCVPSSEVYGLQNQMYNYHTCLRATHAYSSEWWSWPLNLKPVWYFVDYHPDGTVSNIFASGNPLVFLFGDIAILLALFELFQILFKKDRLSPLFIPLLGFFIFWLPWAISPRIMFLYHYAPSVPFLSLVLGYKLEYLNNTKHRHLFILALVLMFLSFLALYPWLTGAPLSRNAMQLFFYFNLTKDPFGSVPWRLPF